MNLIQKLALSLWQYIVEPTFFEGMKVIKWGQIFLRLITSEQGQKMSLISALFAIRKYQLFLFLIQKYPSIRMVPNQEIDAVLHAHIANIDQFEQDCLHLFNTCCQHIPEFGLRGEAERLEWQLAFAQTQELFELNYGQDTMGNSPAACCEILLGCR
ncbi:hypothetical protein [Nodularia sphaerocarpa]|uniref:hypothetical protein n=1 Tax=Nodularia sphaerocarpa TaxID=137816 RepID=UPI001EFAB9AA|nr:hypothetical protein [Nodularia sphaerocarpa]MDB9373841.1 hypothetical protein [Nodularia sphaerocarpa CS-585]MDB9377018.1 hypothetical protein [Nodularia sphaerocarpa CS-585A2]ULP72851.1 hypothetical protein BDGGKGIB_02502 [Nodularia sphaerocarpa UHCC 0038]